MDRLTERTGEGQAIPRMDLKNNGHQRCMERLAEYEDFEEIFRSKMTDASCDFLKDKEEFAKWLDRNKWIAKKCDEYARAEEQGKLLKLPCAVGDAVYEICEGFIEPCTVETIFLADYKDKAGNPSYMMEIYYDREDCPWVSTEIYFTDIGKTVFLTIEEAEAALKELERGKVE